MQPGNVLNVYVRKSRLQRMSCNAPSYKTPPNVYFALVPSVQELARKFPRGDLGRERACVSLGSILTQAFRSNLNIMNFIGLL